MLPLAGHVVTWKCIGDTEWGWQSRLYYETWQALSTGGTVIALKSKSCLLVIMQVAEQGDVPFQG